MRQDEIRVPQEAACLLLQLQQAGHSAYVVGGCVRDSLLGCTPKDWDLCTSATPAQIKALFAAEHLLLNGEKHGTVTVMRGRTGYEITTYRQESSYTDHRHPDAVTFVPELEKDLARRDFTVNAMAYAPGAGLQDPFGGQQDLRAKCVRCVGQPADRFAEDALRILRAVRFAAELDFTLDDATAQAALALRDTVSCVSAERVFAELDRLLLAPAAGRVLAQYGAILAGAVPEIAPCIGCAQTGPWHCYDVWQHTAATVAALQLQGWNEQGGRVLRWAAFLHDLAKPLCRSVEPNGVVHFRGHNQRGAQMARTILRRLRAPGYLSEGVRELVAIHDAPLPTKDQEILQWLNRYGVQFLQRLCALKRADLKAHAQNERVAQRAEAVRVFEARMKELAVTGCYTVAGLRLNGGDVMEAGLLPGPAVGKTLQQLLLRVMEGQLPNEHGALLAALPQIPAFAAGPKRRAEQ